MQVSEMKQGLLQRSKAAADGGGPWTQDDDVMLNEILSKLLVTMATFKQNGWVFPLSGGFQVEISFEAPCGDKVCAQHLDEVIAYLREAKKKLPDAF